MSGVLRIWTMRTEGLTEANTVPWLDILDSAERSRAARFVFERHRVTFIAAHTLARCVLSRIDGSQPPDAWRFVPGEHGKPVAWAPTGKGPWAAVATPASASALAGTPASTPSPARYAPASLTFNLSHTDGLVGLATLSVPGRRLGFDVEPVSRAVNLDVADRFFRPEETGWLRSLPPAGRPEGFLRLWTLKEAFIKATGEGLARDLASFWFDVPETAISFAPRDGSATADAAADDDPNEWLFEQRVIGGDYLAAVGLQRPVGSHIAASWVDVLPGMLRDGGAGLATC